MRRPRKEKGRPKRAGPESELLVKREAAAQGKQHELIMEIYWKRKISREDKANGLCLFIKMAILQSRLQ